MARRGRRRASFPCPNCGESVPVGALACRACGSDAETGWSEEADSDLAGLPTGFAHEGIRATNSSLYLFETEVSGGSSLGEGTFVGADAVHLTNTFLFAAGCTFTGGCGSDSISTCGVGGGGGAGLWALTGPRPQLLDTVLEGGRGLCADFYPFCGSCGPDGPVDASGALVLFVPLPLRPPGVGAVTIYAQAAAVSPVGAAVLGAPSQLTIP